MAKSKFYYKFVFCYILYVAIGNIISLNLFGIHFYSLYSSSMEPSISPGSLVIVREQTSAYDIGDVVAYWAKLNEQEVIIAHRIVRFGGNVYVTQGDDNQEVDFTVIIPRLIVGKVIISLPYFGYIYSFLSHPVTAYFLVFVPGVYIAIVEILKIYRLIN